MNAGKTTKEITLSIKTPDIKKLYSLSAGRCNICKCEVFENNVHIGQMAHVIASSDKGPRGQNSLEERDAYENLILLCANHHIEVDRSSQHYTIEKLHEIKNIHENHIETQLNSSLENDKDIHFLNTFMQYIAFVKLPGYVNNMPTAVNIDILDVHDTFENMLLDFPDYYPFENEDLNNNFNMFFDSYFRLIKIITGDFKGKNIYCSVHDNLIEKKLLISYQNKNSFEHSELLELNISIEKARTNFLEKYYSLLNFIRDNYKNVNTRPDITYY